MAQVATTQGPAPMLTMTGHVLCPILHSWSMALTLTGRVPGGDFSVRRLAYEERALWGKLTPEGASLPFLEAERDMLSGALPVLQWFEETLPGSRLLPQDPIERVRVRNRALLAIDLFDVTKTLLISKSSVEERKATEQLFGVLGRCAAQRWSSRPRLDWVLLAAGATVLVSQPKIMADAHWALCSAMKTLLLSLSEDDVAVATRAAGYADACRSFFRAFGSTLDETMSAVDDQ